MYVKVADNMDLSPLFDSIQFLPMCNFILVKVSISEVWMDFLHFELYIKIVMFVLHSHLLLLEPGIWHKHDASNGAQIAAMFGRMTSNAAWSRNP